MTKRSPRGERRQGVLDTAMVKQPTTNSYLTHLKAKVCIKGAASKLYRVSTIIK